MAGTLDQRMSADHDAVRAALMLAWSNGPVEAGISRPKTLKHQMHGRAGPDLPERRVLPAAWSSRMAENP